MYAHPALVRPHFASVFDRPVAVWIARLGTRKAALAQPPDAGMPQ